MPDNEYDLIGIRTYFFGTLLGIAIGGIAFLSGVTLLILGVAGKVDLIAKGSGVEIRMLNGTPGLAVALLAVIVLWRYKPVVSRSTKDKDRSYTRQAPTNVEADQRLKGLNERIRERIGFSKHSY